MTRRRPRGLDPEEAELWRAVARTARPLGPGRAPPAGPSAPPPAPAPTAGPAADPASVAPPVVAPPVVAPPPPAAAWAVPPFRIGERADAAGTGRRLPPPPAGGPPAEPPRMDARAFARLGRGRLEPEARLDLHGLTLAEAEPALRRFVLGSQLMGRRLVLVITGKGRARDDAGPIPARQGLLRAQVPRWLERPPLAAAVVQAVPAHRRHGGSGALYLWLRRLPGG